MKKPSISKRNAVFKSKRLFDYYQRLKQKARELDELKEQRKPADTVILQITDENGDEYLNVELSQNEWKVVRGYLMKIRTEELREEGVDI